MCLEHMFTLYTYMYVKNSIPQHGSQMQNGMDGLMNWISQLTAYSN